MLWSLMNLSSSPLHPTKRLWWMLGIIILPGIGSLAWLWWIKRYYPRRKALEPDWDPVTNQTNPPVMGRPRPGSGKYQRPSDWCILVSRFDLNVNPPVFEARWVAL